MKGLMKYPPENLGKADLTRFRFPLDSTVLISPIRDRIKLYNSYTDRGKFPQFGNPGFYLLIVYLLFSIS